MSEITDTGNFSISRRSSRGDDVYAIAIATNGGASVEITLTGEQFAHAVTSRVIGDIPITFEGREAIGHTRKRISVPLPAGTIADTIEDLGYPSYTSDRNAFRDTAERLDGLLKTNGIPDVDASNRPDSFHSVSARRDPAGEHLEYTVLVPNEEAAS